MRYRFVHELGILRSGVEVDEAAVWRRFVEGGYVEQAHVVSVHVRTNGTWRQIFWQQPVAEPPGLDGPAPAPGLAG